MSIQSRLERAEKIIAKIHGQPSPKATLTMENGTTKTMFWDDAVRVVLDGGVLAVESDNGDVEGLLQAMM